MKKKTIIDNERAQHAKVKLLSCASKKAQVEMMGLVIIVILITIGFFFAVSMNKTETKKTPLDVFGDEQLSANFLITLLETQVQDCTTLNGKVTLRDLAIDCVRENVSSQQKYSCQGKKSCDVLYNITEIITNETLLLSNNFELLFNYMPPGPPEGEYALLNITEGGGCPGIKNAPALQPIPLFKFPGGGNSYFILSIC